MKESQIPRKDLSQRRSKESPSSKLISDQAKKTPNSKITKKSLNSEFSSVSEDLLSESVTESFNFSPISEVLSEKHDGESIDSSQWLLAEDNSSIPVIEEALTASDSASSMITTVNDEVCDLSADRRKVLGSNYTVEAEMVINLLKQARVEVLSSTDINPSSKKLLDALVEVSVKEFHALPDEDDKVDFLIAKRTRVLLFSFVVWLTISLGMILFSGGSGARISSSFYPPPT